MQGTVSVANNNAHIVITGAEITKLDVYLWPGGHLQGSMGVGAGGSGAADVPVQNPGAAYEISDHSNVGLVSGFNVP
jgi:hypothetical protein